MKSYIFIFMSFLLASCAHTFMRGTVAKKINSKKAVICLGSNEVKVGDIVIFQESVCSSSPTHNISMHENAELGGVSNQTGYGVEKCELTSLGFGTVSELLNDHYSMVETKGDFVFKESTQVEVKK